MAGIDGEDRTRGRVRRRRPRPIEFDDTVASPCISVCQVDEADDVCIGCYRHIDEIRDWPILGAEEKREILARCVARKASARATSK